MKRVLLAAATTGYQTRTFGDAAARLGLKLVFATDRCDQLEDPWWDAAIPVRFQREAASIDALARAIAETPIDGVLAVGDQPTVLAAHAARLAGVPWHTPEAAARARDKRLSRAWLAAAGLPVPPVMFGRLDEDEHPLIEQARFPCVVKPTCLSGSRGVIRANDRGELAAALARVRRILREPHVRAQHRADAELVQVEGYIEGVEYALEGVLERGRLRTLALFDKPDPLVGPFFEETIYVTPSRAPETVQAAIRETVARACEALGLWHGPIHAECRVNDAGVFVLEVAARPIGGLCARALAFEDDRTRRAGLEELLLRQATGESLSGWSREPRASAVMMIPIPKAGVYRGVRGMDDARRVGGVEDVVITAKPDQRIVPLPEGASYLGFVFARAGTPADAEAAVRAAHARLAFTIDGALPVVTT